MYIFVLNVFNRSIRVL